MPVGGTSYNLSSGSNIFTPCVALKRTRRTTQSGGTERLVERMFSQTNFPPQRRGGEDICCRPSCEEIHPDEIAILMCICGKFTRNDERFELAKVFPETGTL